MKIIFKYTASKFWAPFFFALGVFCLVALIGDVFENMRSLSMHETATFRYVLKYSFLRLPYWLGMLVPLACMLASVFAVSEMAASGEWTAAVAGGYRPAQLFLPIILCVILVSFFSFLNQEFVNPAAERKSEQVFKTRLRGVKDYRADVQANVTLKLPGNKILFAREAQSKTGLMTDVTMDFYDENWEIERQVVARKLAYKDGRWVFVDGLERNFPGGTEINETRFEEMENPEFTFPPQEVIFGKTSESNTSLYDLLRKIKFLARSGLKDYREKTHLHGKLAMPVTTVLMCMLAMPFAITLKRKSKAVNIIIALVLAFVFWSLNSVAVLAGESGMISPFLAAWGLSLVCAAAVFLQYKKMKL